MAERRMFSKTIVDSDLFLDMPLSAQALYFHLAMRADDDGFVNNPRKIQRMTGASVDDLKLLMAKRYIMSFDSGIVVVTHWRVHNYIRPDRYTPTSCIAEWNQLELQTDKSYIVKVDTIGIPSGVQDDIPTVDNPRPQVRVGKGSVGEGRDSIEIGEDTGYGADAPTPKPARHKYGEYSNVLLTDADMQKLKEEYPSEWESLIERLSAYMASTGKSYKSHLATMRNWMRRDEAKKPVANASQGYARQPKPYTNPALDYVRELERREKMQNDGIGNG